LFDEPLQTLIAVEPGKSFAGPDLLEAVSASFLIIVRKFSPVSKNFLLSNRGASINCIRELGQRRFWG
jgi:hypothetical protein